MTAASRKGLITKFTFSVYLFSSVKALFKLLFGKFKILQIILIFFIDFPSMKNHYNISINLILDYSRNELLFVSVDNYFRTCQEFHKFKHFILSSAVNKCNFYFTSLNEYQTSACKRFTYTVFTQCG